MKNINQVLKYSYEQENSDGYYDQLEYEDSKKEKSKNKKKKKCHKAPS